VECNEDFIRHYRQERAAVLQASLHQIWEFYEIVRRQKEMNESARFPVAGGAVLAPSSSIFAPGDCGGRCEAPALGTTPATSKRLSTSRFMPSATLPTAKAIERFGMLLAVSPKSMTICPRNCFFLW
jgi:hypothetical protein